MAKLDKAGLYVDTQNLFEVLYDAQFEVPKRDRIALVTRMLDHAEKIIGHFALTYQSEDKKVKLERIDQLIAEFEALKTDCRLAINKKMFKSEKTIFKIREQIVRIDEGVSRWKQYVVNTRQEQHPCGEASPKNL